MTNKGALQVELKQYPQNNPEKERAVKPIRERMIDC